MLAQWIAGQQYLTAEAASYGALKAQAGVAASDASGAQFSRVSPYFANLGVLGLLSAGTPGCVEIADRWIGWFFGHLSIESAPDGVPDDHFYQKDGGGETTCVQPGVPALCHSNDATDSAAATFFSVLCAAHQAGVANFKTPQRKEQIESLAGVLLALQQPDGLCWAKRQYRVKYLEDNSEVYAGLRDLARLECELFGDEEKGHFYGQAADRVQRAISQELYEEKSGLYLVAKFESGRALPAHLEKWYPDCQAQAWPHLFGVVAASDPKTVAVMSAVAAHWSGERDWAGNPERINGGWIESGHAYAALLSGEREPARIYLEALRRRGFFSASPQPRFPGPFTLSDAGWLLDLIKALENSLKL